MPRLLSILILFILLSAFLFSTSTDYLANDLAELSRNSTLRMPLLEQTVKTEEKIHLNKFLIYISRNMSKNYIYPFLSAENLIQLFSHFQKLEPQVEFQKFLPPQEFRTSTHIVLDVNHGKNYLYQFQNPNCKPILFLTKNKIPKILEKVPPNVLPDSILAILPQCNKIVPFENFTLNTGEEVMVARDEYDCEFFFVLKLDEAEFETIAFGKICDMKFPNYLEVIWEAHNLKDCKKTFFLRLRHCVFTIPCLQYLKYLVCLLKLFKVFASRLGCINSCVNRIENCFPSCVFAYAGGFILTMLLGLLYGVVTFPFQSMTIFLYFYYELSFLQFWQLSFYLPFVYVLLFPQIKGLVPYLNKEFNLNGVSQSFKIKPRFTMWKVPYIIQQKTQYCEEFLLTLVWLVCLILSGLILSVEFWLLHELGESSC